MNRYNIYIYIYLDRFDIQTIYIYIHILCSYTWTFFIHFVELYPTILTVFCAKNPRRNAVLISMLGSTVVSH